MHAFILNNEIQSLGSPPQGARRLDTDQWVTPPDGGWTVALLAACGWLPVTATPRPADTDTTTHDYSVELVAGTPTETWTARDKTPAEIEAEARLVSIEDRLAALEAHAWPAQPDPADTTGVPTWAELGGIAPAGALLLDGGKVWRNVSGAPLTAPPSGFPGWTEAQLAHLWAIALDTTPEPEPPTTQAWVGGTAYQAGDTVTHAGRTWRCKLAHTDASWAPGPSTHAVWEDIGPA